MAADNTTSPRTHAEARTLLHRWSEPRVTGHGFVWVCTDCERFAGPMPPPRDQLCDARLLAEVARLTARVAYLEAGLDAIARVTEGNGHCLSTCACNANPDNDCDCGYCAAEDPGPFAADVVAGEADLDGALRLDTTDRSES